MLLFIGTFNGSAQLNLLEEVVFAHQVIDVLGKRSLREGRAVKCFQEADYDAHKLMQEA